MLARMSCIKNKEPNMQMQCDLTKVPLHHEKNKASSYTKSVSPIRTRSYLARQKNVESFELPSSSKKIKKASLSKQRQDVGGKGHFLYRIQSIGLPVPDFICITAQDTVALFQIPIALTLQIKFLQKTMFHSGVIETEDPVTLMQCIHYIKTLPPIEQNKACAILQDLMRDPLWIDQIAQDSRGQFIMQQCQDWLQEKQIDDEVIVRSSGILEDHYGHSQAGRYASKICQVKEDSILSTLSYVLASGIIKDSIQEDSFQPMALIMQKHMMIQAGGVGFSCTSLTDLSFQISISKDPLSTTVSGIGLCEQDREMVNIAREQSTDDIPFLTPENSSQLKEALLQLESNLMCPVDIEFGEDQDKKLWILQARPVTTLSGATTYDIALECQIAYYASGSICNEGLGVGPLYCMDYATCLMDIPKNAIVFAKQGYELMLTSNFLEKIAGLIIPSASSTSHLAIQCSQYKVPLMSNLVIKQTTDDITDDIIENKANQTMTLLCSYIQQTPYALLWLDDQTSHIQSIAISMMLDLTEYTSRLHQVNSRPNEPFSADDQGITLAFFWLEEQNTHLLSYLKSTQIINSLLSPLQSILWLMHSDRLAFMALLEQEIKYFMEDMDSFYDMYIQFIENCRQSISREEKLDIPYFRNKKIKDSIIILKQVIDWNLLDLKEALDEKNPLLISGWQEICEKINNTFNLLNSRYQFEIDGFHGVIYLIHQSFIGVYKQKNIIIDEQKSFFSEKCKNLPYVVFAEYNEHCFASLDIGCHKCTVNISKDTIQKEHYILTASYSEKFNNSGHQYRLWFVVQLVDVFFKKNMSLDISQEGNIIKFNFKLINIHERHHVQKYFILWCQLINQTRNLDLCWLTMKLKCEMNLSLPMKYLLTQKNEESFQIFLLDYLWRINLSFGDHTFIKQYLPEIYQDLLLFIKRFDIIRKKKIDTLPENIQTAIILYNINWNTMENFMLSQRFPRGFFWNIIRSKGADIQPKNIEEALVYCHISWSDMEKVMLTCDWSPMPWSKDTMRQSTQVLSNMIFEYLLKELFTQLSDSLTLQKTKKYLQNAITCLYSYCHLTNTRS